MKKVLFICSLYHPHVGGIETMITELACFYKKQGIEPIVLTKKWPLFLEENDEFKDVKIYRVLSARTEGEFLEIINWIKINELKIKADIIHIIGARRPLPLIGLLLSHYWNVPLVSTIAGGEIPNTGDSQTEKVWNEGKDLVKSVLESSDVVTCVSKALEKDLKKVVPNLKSVRTIYAGIDIELINSIICTETEKNYIVSLRRLIPSKGIDVLINAFKILTEKYPNMKLLIAGEGSEEKNLKNLVKKINLEKNVHFIGTVSFNKAISLLRGAICTVVPSFSEGGGLVNVEAQAAKCPVIASNVGGIPEYVYDKESGLLFKPGDVMDLAKKIELLILSDSMRNKLIKGGIKYSKKFNWSVLGPQYLALYLETLTVNKIRSFKPWSDLTKTLWLNLVNI